MTTAFEHLEHATLAIHPLAWQSPEHDDRVVPSQSIKRSGAGLLAGMTVVLLVACAWVLHTFYSTPVKVEVVPYGARAWPGYGSSVFVNLTNTSAKSSFNTYNDCLDVLPSRFVSSSPTGEVVRRNPLTGSPTRHYVLAPHSQLKLKVLLPDDGHLGRLSVGFAPPPSKLRVWVQRACIFLGLRPPQANFLWVECPVEIRCPRALPSGNYEPLRLL